METANELFLTAIEWLRTHYSEYRFFAERDVVWTIQSWLIATIEEQEMPLKVFNDYPMLPGKQRSRSTDIAILNQADAVEVAIEIKYEPSHKRRDILPSKFPVVFWGDDGVGKDVRRIQEFVASGKTPVAYSVFIDEGGYFRKRPPLSTPE